MALNSLKTRRVQEGKNIDFPASEAITSGDPVQLPDGRIGIVITDTVSGGNGAAEVRSGAVYSGVKAAGALSKGAALWWDAINKVYAASGSFRVGVVLEDAAAADAEVTFSLNTHLLAGAVKAAHLDSSATAAQIVAALQAAGLMATA